MIVLLLILLVAVYTDYKYGKIPNVLIIVGLGLGLLVSYIRGQLPFLVEGIAGIVLPVLLLYPAFIIGGMGAGDLKLFSVVGSFLGIRGVLISLIIAFVLGAIFSVVMMIRFHYFKERIYYFFSYVTDLFVFGKWKLYESEEKPYSDDGFKTFELSEFPKHKIHFALPVFLGALVYVGGIL